jgi:glycosyltransferase involved in cell wall biosynthesis
VATSQWAARRVVELHGIASERVHVAAPGVEPAPPAIGTDGVSRLLCVGAITRTKGQDLLVEALATLTDRPWHCNLVGPSHRSPGYVADLRASIDRHGLGGRVRLVGPLHPAQLVTVYDATDLLVLPSRAETYGMVITEALARGIPVLAAATGGVPNTMRATGIATARATSTLIPPGIPPDGPTSPLIHPPVPSERATSPLIASRVPDERSPGMLVAPDDVAALAAGLRRWFDEPVLRAGLRRSAARRRDELTGWEVTSRCLAQVLDQHNGTSR